MFTFQWHEKEVHFAPKSAALDVSKMQNTHLHFRILEWGRGGEEVWLNACVLLFKNIASLVILVLWKDLPPVITPATKI